METVDIGKGMLRITVRSKARRDRLKAIAGVTVRKERVIFPTWMRKSIEGILVRSRRRERRAEQIDWIEEMENTREAANG